MTLDRRCPPSPTPPILFDLDGVLVDSMPQAAAAVRDWARGNGLDAARIVEMSAGLPDRDLVRRVAPHLDATAEAQAIERREEALAETLEAVPGASRLLREVSSGPWAIVTSSARRVAVQRLTAADLPVPPNLITADDVERGKPDPEPYLLGADLLGWPPELCVVVEDSATGAEAARRAGAFVVGFVRDETESNVLSAADVTVSHLDNVLSAIRDSFDTGVRSRRCASMITRSAR